MIEVRLMKESDKLIGLVIAIQIILSTTIGSKVDLSCKEALSWTLPGAYLQISLRKLERETEKHPQCHRSQIDAYYRCNYLDTTQEGLVRASRLFRCSNSVKLDKCRKNKRAVIQKRSIRWKAQVSIQWGSAFSPTWRKPRT